MNSCKKQLIMTAFVLSCVLLVFALYFFAPTYAAPPTDAAQIDVRLFFNATALPLPDNAETLSRPFVRLLLYGALPFTLDKLRFISLIQIALIAILISLFIKSDDPTLECIFDSDGKK